MPITRTRRLRITELANDRTVVVGIQALTDYTPADKIHTPAKLLELTALMDQAHEAEILALNQYTAARDAAGIAEWTMHEAVLRTKSQVIAQYGPDSNAVQSLGLKKRVDRKRPVRRTPKNTDA